jgi:drug/metabolite transporter (DMT)-like permease
MRPPSPPSAPGDELALSHRAARERKALWVALVLILVWGSNFSVQKMVFTAMSPGGFLMARYLLMPVAAALLLCWRHGLHWPRVPRHDLLQLLKLGIAGHLLHVGLVTYGIH